MRGQMMVERHFSDTLVALCGEMKLSDIGVADVVAGSGMSRQTLYNHFDGLHDVVDYTAARALFAGLRCGSLFDGASIVGFYQFAYDCRQFYSQLPGFGRPGYGSYREKLVRWLRKKGYETYAPARMTGAERLRRMCQIDLYVAGSTEVAFTWMGAGCLLPIDVVAGSVIDMAPGFLREGNPEGILPLDPRDYPR